MGDESDGQAGRGQPDGLVGKSKKCAGEGCHKIFIPPPGTGNWLYCSDECKNSKKATPKSKKRDNSTLSPNDSLAKQSKDDFFEAVLDCDLATFLSLSQDDPI